MADTVRFGKLHRTMLERGVYLAPSAFEAEGLTDGELDGMERRYWKLGSSIEIEPQGISEVWDRKETFDHRAFARAAIAADRARRPTPHPQQMGRWGNDPIISNLPETVLMTDTFRAMCAEPSQWRKGRRSWRSLNCIPG
jgi:hypothetical protein